MGRIENDTNVQNHIDSKPPKANNITSLQNPSFFNTAMSKEQHNRPQQPPSVVLGTTKLNQATPPIPTGTAVVASTTTSSSNVIQQTNNKNTMLSSFVSVIEGTKDLSISDEKQRSPKHQHHQQRQGSSKAMSSLPKQHPLLENTNLNSVEAKLPAAPTVITPNFSAPSIKSG